MKRAALALALALSLSLAAARVQTEAEAEPWTQLPLRGLEGSQTNQGRKLSGTSNTPAGPLATQTTSSDLGAVGESTYCNVYSATATTPACVGNYPFPACCDGDLCATNADGTGGKCSNAAPYPACCPAFSRASDRCTSTDSTQTCSADSFPVPACCDLDYCYVFADASSTRCTDDRVAGCCPA